MPRQISPEQEDIIRRCRESAIKAHNMAALANAHNLLILARELWDVSKRIEEMCDMQVRSFRDDTLLP